MPDCQIDETPPLDAVCLLKRTLVTAEEPDEKFHDLVRGLLDSGRGLEVVDIIENFAVKGSIAKAKLLIAALAICTTYATGNAKDVAKTRRAVYNRLVSLCSIPSALFQLLMFEKDFSPAQKVSFSRSKRHGLDVWYNAKSPRDLAMTVTKYRRRNQWSHYDVLKLAHVRPANPGVELVLKYVLKGIKVVKTYMEEGGGVDEKPEDLRQVYKYLVAVETVRHSRDEQEVARIVEEHRLMREHIPTWMMKSKEVWKALLNHMPVFAMIKNLNHLGVLGLLEPCDAANCVQLVLDRLRNEQLLRDAKVHPLNILLAMKAYERGRQDNSGKGQWKPNLDVITALETAFYKAFGTVEHTNKNYMLAIDASESMHYGSVLSSGNLVTPLVAAAALSLTVARCEPAYQVVALLGGSIEPIDVTPSTTLAETCSLVSRLKTRDSQADCSRPILWAAANKKIVDVFVVYTDQRGSGATATAGGGDVMTPMKALKRYRDEMAKPNTRLVVVTLTCPETSMVDGTDPLCLHLAGFDSSTPEVIRSFALGDLDSVPAG